MKFGKKLLILVLAVAMMLTVIACNPSNKNDPNNNNNNNSDPIAAIPKLPDITDYSSRPEYLNGAPVTYGDTTAERTKLAARIADKKEDVNKGEANSSAVKIFAASDAAKIIKAMEDANLPDAQMTATVNYLAGQESHTDAEIGALVIEFQGQPITKDRTSEWSFFDDWTYYDKLKDEEDRVKKDEYATKKQKDTAADNVKRQYRYILGKVFAIGMTGDQFARFAVYELAYATTVVEGMANEAGYTNAKLSVLTTGLNDFDRYCQENLDYETLVYLRAFNDYYKMDGSNDGKGNCVKLYGYYYDYNKTDYRSQSDTEFEKQLSYGHMNIFTDTEWLDYVDLQRKSYVNAYRYTDSFYDTFYRTHFNFQENIENHERCVYGIEKWNQKSYTAEMREAINDSGLVGQLNFTDWLYVRAGDSSAMKNYNAANSQYENAKENHPGEDEEYNGQFAYNMEQLKTVYFLLNNMSASNLSRTLRFQVYSYSGEMVKSAQGYQKDISLIKANKKTPSDAIKVIDGLNAAKEKEYAEGKIGAILNQMGTTYTTVGVKGKADQAAQQSWTTMRDEVKTAIDTDYSDKNGKAKVDALEDTVIKRNWSCGGNDDEDDWNQCPNNPGKGHLPACKKDYDTKHKISQFVSNYESILRYMAGSVKIDFQNNIKATEQSPNKYNVKRYENNTLTFTPGFEYSGTPNAVTAEMLNGVAYTSIKEISVTSGNTFRESIVDIGGADKKWFDSSTSGYENYQAQKIATAASTNTLNVVTLEETNPSNNNRAKYQYTYTFKGWYLDTNLVYKFNPDDVIRCDLTLYAGYEVQKKLVDK